MLDITRPWEAHIDQRLRADPIIWLASTRPDGRPHVVPVWFLYDGTTILMFSLPATQKVRNLRQNPAVMLALDSARHGNEIIMLEGRASLLDDPTVQATLPAFADKYAALRQSTPVAWAARFSQAIRIDPLRVVSWGGEQA
jgi:PPOX class probable F420-dependent enzyme